MKFEATGEASPAASVTHARLFSRVDEQRARVRGEAHGPRLAVARQRDRPGQRAPRQSGRDQRGGADPHHAAGPRHRLHHQRGLEQPGPLGERNRLEARRVERRVERPVVFGASIQLDRAPGAGVLREQRRHGLEDRLLVGVRLEVHGATRGAGRESGWRRGSG